MDKQFLMGIALGMIGGALIVVNCKKAKDLVEKGQQTVEKQIKKMKKKHQEDNMDNEMQEEQ